MNDSLTKIMDLINEEGAPPLSKADWVDLLERVIEECESLAAAAREEIGNGE